MFDCGELNLLLRGAVNEHMRMLQADNRSELDELVMKEFPALVNKVYDALLSAADAEQMDYDDARGVYDFWMDVQKGTEKPSFVE